VRFLGVDYEDLESDAQSFTKEFRIAYPSIRNIGGSLATTFEVNRRWDRKDATRRNGLKRGKEGCYGSRDQVPAPRKAAGSLALTYGG
jgi:hypothetical protein